MGQRDIGKHFQRKIILFLLHSREKRVGTTLDGFDGVAAVVKM
jgi:hypothetical protein